MYQVSSATVFDTSTGAVALACAEPTFEPREGVFVLEAATQAQRSNIERWAYRHLVPIWRRNDCTEVK